MPQNFAVAATKADFDSTIAIYLVSTKELVALKTPEPKAQIQWMEAS